MKTKVLTVFGTRPEAIKLAPVIKKLEERSDQFISRVCVSGQHREQLDQALDVFSIRPDHDLNVMRPRQDLFDVTVKTLLGLKSVFVKEKPDWILVQGDTTTAMAASLAAFYCKIAIGHVETGLRTYNKLAPFPEEVNRQVIDSVWDFFFAPTTISQKNLLREGISANKVVVTGNTVIDAVMCVAKKVQGRSDAMVGLPHLRGRRMILVTAHRRESFGEDMRTICHSLLEIARNHPEVSLVFPVHLNPNVQRPVREILKRSRNVHLIPPQDYETFVWLMMRSYLILTDSGGIQEEAPALHKPVLVMRRVSERPEGIKACTTRLVGINQSTIVKAVEELMGNTDAYRKMAEARNPYGDGTAAARIVDALISHSGISYHSTC